MIHILDYKTEKIVGTLENKQGAALFWKDVHKQSLKENLETFDFFMQPNVEEAEYTSKRNRVIIPDEDGFFREFIIRQAYQTNRVKEVYSLASYTDLEKQKIISPITMDGETINTAGSYVLQGSGWQLGNTQFAGRRRVVFEKHIGALSALKILASLFGLELRFRVEVSGNRITGRYVDFLEKVGLNTKKEIELGKDLIGITRKENTEIFTALRGIGPEREDGTRLIVEVKDEEARQRWSDKDGSHLWGVYEPQSSDANMTEERLTQLTRAELDKRINSVVQYEADAASIEHIFGYSHEKVRIGDTTRIKDTSFVPPLYVEARVIDVERSVSKKSQKKFILGDFIEYRKEDIMKVWRELQSMYATKVIKSADPPPGRPHVIWIKPGGAFDVGHIWNSEAGDWEKTTPTEAGEVGAETPEGASEKANNAKTEAIAAAEEYTRQELTNYVTAVTYGQDLEEIQNQLDGNITSWFYTHEPALTNAPAIDWSTNAIKNQHLGDLFYNTSNGYSYRFAFENNVYKWILLKDSDVQKALQDAAKAQDTADNKRRVFVAQPVPPYDLGDLWAQGTNGDILHCSTAKIKGQSFSASDWVKASKYTDDSRAIQAESNAKGYADAVGEAAYNDALNDSQEYMDLYGLILGALYNGVSITNSDGLVIARGDGLVRTVANATGGFRIQRRENTTSPWVDLFYVNTEGKLYVLNAEISGVLNGATGTFNGTVEGGRFKTSGTAGNIDIFKDSLISEIINVDGSKIQLFLQSGELTVQKITSGGTLDELITISSNRIYFDGQSGDYWGIRKDASGDTFLSSNTPFVLQQVIRPLAHASISMLNGWSAYGNGTVAPRYTKKADGWVSLSGAAKGGLVGVYTLGTLPVGCRPYGIEFFKTGTYNNGTAEIVVYPNGDIRVNAATNNTWVSLSGVSFYAEN